MIRKVSSRLHVIPLTSISVIIIIIDDIIALKSWDCDYNSDYDFVYIILLAISFRSRQLNANKPTQSYVLINYCA